MFAGFCIYSPQPESLSSSHSALARGPHSKPEVETCHFLLPSNPIALYHRKMAIWFFFPGLGILYPAHLWKIDP